MSEITPYLPGFIAAYSILIIGAFSPGPSVAMLIGIASEQGRAPALVATLGVALGSATINLMTILGVGLILSQAAWAMSILKFVGAAYLLYLSYGAFRKVIYPLALQSTDLNHRTPMKHFIAGYLLQVTNPKAIAFWLAIASIEAVKGAGVEVVILFITGGFIISFVFHGAWAVALSASSIRSAYIVGRRWIEMFLGSFFVFAAYKLSTAES